MHMHNRLITVFATTIALLATAQAQLPAPTYQGRLLSDGVAAQGPHEIRLGLYAAPDGGSAIQTITYPAVDVIDGLFTVPLDFDLGSWGDGTSRYIGVEVRQGSDPFVALAPRQPVTPTPLALRAVSVAGLQPFIGLTRDQVIAEGVWLTAGINIANRPWQSFTPSVSGYLRAVDVFVDVTTNGGVAEVVLFAGEPTGAHSSLRTSSLNVPDGTEGLLRVDFEPGVWLNAGERYTVRLGSLNGVTWRANSTNPYAGGRGVSGPEYDFRMDTYMETAQGLSAIAPLAINSSTSDGDLNIGDYQGGTLGSAIAGFEKQVVIAGTYNTGTNAGSAVKLLIADYDNDNSSIFPIFVEDENNGIDFYVRNESGDRSAYFGGDIGVGTVAPEAPLHIETGAVGANWQVRLSNTAVPAIFQGGIRLGDTGLVEVSSQALAVGSPFARLNTVGIWTVASDRRFKKHITPSSSADLLAAAMALRPVRYQYNSESDLADGEAGSHIGLIAQELQSVLPEFVTDSGDLMTVDYAGLSVVAIGAIQEQQQRLDATQAELRTMREENAELRVRLEKIEKLLVARE